MRGIPVVRGQCDACGFSRNLYLNEMMAPFCDHQVLGCQGRMRKVWAGQKKAIPEHLLNAYDNCTCKASDCSPVNRARLTIDARSEKPSCPSFVAWAAEASTFTEEHDKQLAWCSLCHGALDKKGQLCQACGERCCSSCSGEAKEKKPERVCHVCRTPNLVLNLENMRPKKTDELISRLRHAYQTIPLSVLHRAGWKDVPTEDAFVAEGYGVLEVKVLQAVGLSADGGACPYVQVECQGAVGRNPTRRNTLAPKWVLEPALEFVCHEPLCNIHVAVMDQRGDDVLGIVKVPLFSLPVGRSCIGFVYLEDPYIASKQDYNRTRAPHFKFSPAEATHVLGGCPLHACHWGSSKAMGAVQLQITFHRFSKRREFISCSLPPLRMFNEPPPCSEWLLEKVFEDVVVCVDISWFQAVQAMVRFVLELALWHSRRRSAIALAVVVAVAIRFPFSQLLFHPVSLATLFSIAVFRAHMRGLHSTVEVTMWNFWGVSSLRKNLNADMLSIQPKGSFEWVPIECGDAIPANAVRFDNRNDSPTTTLVARAQGEAGQIQEKSGKMLGFTGHLMGRLKAAEILITKPAAHVKWVPLMRGDTIPNHSVLAGWTDNDGETYVGRWLGEAGKINTLCELPVNEFTTTSSSPARDSDSTMAALPAHIQLILKSAKATGAAKVSLNAAQSRSIARLAVQINRIKKVVIWLRRALGAAQGSGTEDVAAGTLLVGCAWVAAIGCTIASPHFWVAIGAAGLLAFCAPGSEKGLCISLGFLRYMLRPAPCDPCCLDKELAQSSLSRNFIAWAKTVHFRLDIRIVDDLFNFLDKDRAQGSSWFPRLSPTWASRFPEVQAAVAWLRGPGLESGFSALWQLHASSQAYLDIVLEDLPRLRQIFRVLMGKYEGRHACHVTSDMDMKVSAKFQQVVELLEKNIPALKASGGDRQISEMSSGASRDAPTAYGDEFTCFS